MNIFPIFQFHKLKNLKVSFAKILLSTPISLKPHGFCLDRFSIGNSPWELAFSNLPLGNPWIAAFFFAMAFAFIATFDLWLGSTFFFGWISSYHFSQHEHVFLKVIRSHFSWKMFFMFFVFCTWSWWYGTFGFVFFKWNVWSRVTDPDKPIPWSRHRRRYVFVVPNKAPAWMRSKPDKLDMILIYVDTLIGSP